jgi:hypothetical protein
LQTGNCKLQNANWNSKLRIGLWELQIATVVSAAAGLRGWCRAAAGWCRAGAGLQGCRAAAWLLQGWSRYSTLQQPNWKILADSRRFWQILADSDRFWQILAGFGRFWQVLAEIPKIC